MLVSIITPVFNASKFIEKTYLSVLSQTYSNWEWILIDDCSTDCSFDLIKQFSNTDTRIKAFKNNENIKSGKTRNIGISKAEGKYIAFLDADDIWHPRKLELQIKFMAENDISFSHTSYGYIDEVGDILPKILEVSNIVDYNKLLRRTEISCLTAIYDCGKIGKFYMSDEGVKEDYYLWLSILKSGVKSYGLNIVLAYYRQVNSSVTSKKYKLIMSHYKFLRDTQNLSIFDSIKFTIYWGINGFFRYYVRFFNFK